MRESGTRVCQAHIVNAALAPQPSALPQEADPSADNRGGEHEARLTQRDQCIAISLPLVPAHDGLGDTR